MVKYRRHRTKGGIYFLTVVLQDRQSSILIEHINLLREAMKQVKESHPFKINAMVILPDHFHAIWELPEDSDNYSQRLRLFKCNFTRKLIKVSNQYTKNHHGVYNIWQTRFWEHTIRDDKDFENHVNYVHYNPVKHGLVKNVKDWPYSTFHQQAQ